MPAIVRLGDKCSGHGCFSARPCVEGSSDVFANGKGVHIVGMAWDSHGCAGCPPHDSVLAAGSPDVFANGKPVGRVGDPIECGSTCAEGSPDCTIN
jgi:uncharacterized Zn-binding protein involved in type VI secretion